MLSLDMLPAKPSLRTAQYQLDITKQVSFSSGTTSEPVASKGDFAMFYDSETGYVTVKNNRTGVEWATNPPGSYENKAASERVISQLFLEFTTASGVQKTVSSYAGSSFSMNTVQNGICVTYLFSAQKFTIPVVYTLEDDGLSAAIYLKDIKTKEETAVLNRIHFLEYFGAGSKDDSGFMLVPDGCGALIQFNNGKSALPSYEKEVYGADLSLRSDSYIETSRMEKITLPVFGIVRNGAGCLAELTQGAEMATVSAAVRGDKEEYNHISGSFVYLVAEKLPLKDQSLASTTDVLYTAMEPVKAEAFAVRYRLLDVKNAGVNDLAGCYRTILQKQGVGGASMSSGSLVTEFYGGVRRRRSFLGILYTAREKLTTFEQARLILEELKKNGVTGIHGLYQDYTGDFFKRNLQINLAPAGILGNKSELQELLEYTSDNEMTMGMGADFISMPTGGNGFSTFFDVVSALNISPVQVYRYHMSKNVRDTSRKPYYLIAPEKYGKAVTKLIYSAKKNQTQSLYFDEDALALYADYSKGGMMRIEAREVWTAQMARLEEACELTLANPNAYLLPYADYVTDLPMESSRNLIFDGDVPFLQLSLSGLVPYSGVSININSNSEKSFLNLLSYGADIKYSLIHSESDVLLTTDHTFLYAATYSGLKEEVEKRAKIISGIRKEINGAYMTGFTTAGTVRITSYSNGKKLYVNTGNEAVVADGKSIDAMSWKMA